MEKKKEDKAPAILRLVDSIKIYDYLKSYINYPSFDDVENKNTKYTTQQLYDVNYVLSYVQSKSKALYECKLVIKYLKKEGYTEFNEDLFEFGLIEFVKKTRERETNALLKIDQYSDNVNILHERQPFFYDKSGLFWIWDKENYKWYMVDDTDVLNMIDKELSFAGQLINSKVKCNYLEAFKQIGRKKMPEDSSPHWVQFKDKVFNIKTKHIERVSPNYFMCNPIPWSIGENSDTPIMDKLFTEWVGKDFVQTLYEIIAYCCLTDYPIHLLFCLVGCGRNGKSQFQKIVQRFIGMDNICSTELDLLIDNRFESAKLYKKLVCTLGETNFGLIKKTSLLKKLSGGDLIGFEFKRKTPFDDYNYSKIIINSNSLPSSLDTSEGFYRRWLIINFPNEFPEGKDIVNSIPEEEYENLSKKIVELLPSLLNKGSFTNQGTIEERKRAYIMASNPLPYFIQLCCDIGDDLFVKSAELYTSYIKYLLANKKRKVSRGEFYEMLSEEGLYTQKCNKPIGGGEALNTNWIDGIRLKENWKLMIFDDSGIKRTNRTVFPLNSSIGELSEKPILFVPFVPEIEFGDVTFHIDRFGDGGLMNVEQLKDDLSINDQFINEMKQSGQLIEVRPGYLKVNK